MSREVDGRVKLQYQERIHTAARNAFDSGPFGVDM